MSKTYDPAKVTLAFGPNIISGFADGTYITGAFMDAERYKSHVGADGEHSWTHNLNKSGTITIRLKSTSASRVVLDGYKETGTVLSCWVINNSDQKHVLGGNEARVANDPDVVYGAEEEMLEYVISVSKMTSASVPA